MRSNVGAIMIGVTAKHNRVGRVHSESLILKDMRTWFVNEEKNIKRLIVDEEGWICNFPGVEYSTELISQWGEREIPPEIRYDAYFAPGSNGCLKMFWTIRPDGRYWMDSWGFGAEDYDTIVLSTYLDEEGHYTGPFVLEGSDTK